MVIYGVAILAFCMLSGVTIGSYIGSIMGINTNIGGVGIAMLVLVLFLDLLKNKGMINRKSEKGLEFWSAMYIPIVIAMTLKQNVVGALDGGAVAIIAGVSAVVVSFILVPVLSSIK